MSVKADLHVLIDGRSRMDDRDLYHVTVMSSPPLDGERLHGN